MNRYAIIITPLESADGGGFLGYCPDLPGCMSDGETRQEALANTELAIAEWLEAAGSRGLPAPPNSAYYRLDDLLAGITADNRHEEMSTGPAVGSEFP